MTLHQEPAPTPVPAEVSTELTDEQLKALAGGYEHTTNAGQIDVDTASTRKALKQVEKAPFLTKKRVIFGLATGAALGIAIPAAVAVVATTQTAPVAEAPGDPTEAPAPVEPSAEPTPVETEAPVVESEYSVSRESVAAYIEMSPEEFATLPKTEQLKLAAYYMQGDNNLESLKEFGDLYYGITKDPRDVFPEAISMDNNAQEIAAVMANSRRFFLSLEGDERQKVLYAVLQNGTSSGAYPALIKLSQDNPTTVPKIAEILALSNTLISETAVSASGMLSDETGPYKEITFQDGSVAKANYYEIAVDQGVFKIWLDE